MIKHINKNETQTYAEAVIVDDKKLENKKRRILNGMVRRQL